MMDKSGTEIWDRALVATAQRILNSREPNRQGWTFAGWVFPKGRPNILFRHFDGRVCTFMAESIAMAVARAAEIAAEEAAERA